MSNQSKWELLQVRSADLRSRIAELQRELDRYQFDLNGGLRATKTYEGMTCMGCQTLLENEEQFAKHFVIRDSRYLNLGECYLGDRVGWSTEEQDDFGARQHSDTELVEQWGYSSADKTSESGARETAALERELAKRGIDPVVWNRTQQ